MHSHLPPPDRAVPELCEPVPRGQRAAVAPAPALHRAALGPRGPGGPAELAHAARRALLDAIRKGITRSPVRAKV